MRIDPRRHMVGLETGPFFARNGWAVYKILCSGHTARFEVGSSLGRSGKGVKVCSKSKAYSCSEEN